MRVTVLTLPALLVGLAGLAGLAGCAEPGPRAVPQPALQLSATLVTPTDIALEWTGRDPRAAGHVLEFATEPQGPYTILLFVPPHQSGYTHPDLMPRTPFYYRLRPYHGPASATIEISLPEGDFDEAAQQLDHGWLAPQKTTGGHATSAGAGPTELAFTVMHANGIKFTWADNASDEAGYLLEAKPGASTGFRVVAVLDPDVTSLGLITEPEEKRATYRVRALYFGPPSNLAHQATGGD